MEKKSISEKEYMELMNGLEELNNEYQELLSSKEMRTGILVCNTISGLKHLNFRALQGLIKARKAAGKLKKINHELDNGSKQTFSSKPQDYFSNDRVAVYTCIFGKYDRVQEPVIKPTNIDYYIITDQEIPEDSMWKKISWESYCDVSLTNAEKNRFFKMHPEKVLSNYRYSIYIDGNIKVISDLTKYICRIGESGLALHYHRARRCVYDELDAIQATYKANADDVASYKTFLINEKMPKDYGLLECNVIVREHNNPKCVRIMDIWWEQFAKHIKRDQVSLPYALYKEGVSIDSVATLGNDVYKNMSFRIVRHY